MSSKRIPTHPVNLEVRIDSQPLDISVTSEDEDDAPATPAPRCWLVTVRTSLDGAEVALGQLAARCDIAGVTAAVETAAAAPTESEEQQPQPQQQQQQLDVSFLGQPDDYCAIYKVTETHPNINSDDNSATITVSLTPRYHHTAAAVYRLDKRLAALVGRDYLAHPKYAITVLLAYARGKRLLTNKSIMCDRLLTDLLGRRWIRNQALWERLSGLMTRVSVDRVTLQHELCTPEPEVRSTAVMEVSADDKQNLFPVQWVNNGLQTTRLQERSHTEGDVPVVAKAATAAVTVKTKRLLQRHKSI